MKAVMISIKPQECEPIASDGRTVLIKKTKPKIKTPFKCYIYCTVSGATKNCSENEKGRKNLLIDYCWDSILDDRQVITQDLRGRRQLGKHTTHAFNYGTVLNGKVIGEFVCDKIYTRPANTLYLSSAQIDYLGLLKDACLSEMEVLNYCGGSYNKDLYFWHISDLKIYDKPKELGDFHKAFEHDNEGFMNCTKISNIICQSKQDRCKYSDCEILQQLYPKITKPPQSWQYCEELEEKK